MNNSLNEKKRLVDLTLHIRSQDGSCTEFYQHKLDLVERTLELLATPRLFSQPLLMLASPESANIIRTRTVDMLIARTPASIGIQWPNGLADIVEVPLDDDAPLPANVETGNGNSGGPLHIGLHTLGGWAVRLALKPEAQLTLQDQRVLLAHFIDLPVIPFRLPEGGVGYINPGQIIRTTGQLSATGELPSKFPRINALPVNAMPMDLLRWLPRASIQKSLWNSADTRIGAL